MRMGSMLAVSIGAAVLALGLPLAMMIRPQAQTLSIEPEGVVEASVSESADTLRLFPDVDKANVEALFVVSAERSFTFERDSGEVSVNGNEADGYAFDTLLKKLITLPVSSRESFDTAQEPILSVTMITQAGEYTAAFYSDGQNGERALIACGTQDEPLYRETDGWRVGTLLMACDGTRIFDEDGNETLAE